MTASVAPTPDGDWCYTPAFLAPRDADALFAAMLGRTDWSHDTVRLFGREHRTPRLVAWYGDPGADYRYSGVTHRARPWPESLAALRARLASEGLAFDGVLANLYRDGRDYMGWHSDDERELGPRPTIASVSVGAPRRFVLRHRMRRDVPDVELVLGHGSLLVMRGETQRCWKHSLPKVARCDAPRVNLTFRLIRRASAAPLPVAAAR